MLADRNSWFKALIRPVQIYSLVGRFDFCTQMMADEVGNTILDIGIGDELCALADRFRSITHGDGPSRLGEHFYVIIKIPKTANVLEVNAHQLAHQGNGGRFGDLG